MTGFRRVVAYVFYAVLGTLIFGSIYAAPELANVGKHYTFPEVRIDGTVNQDGSLSIIEHRTFDFHGSYSFAFFTVQHRFPGDVTNFSVRDPSTEYRAFGSPGGPIGPLEPGALEIEDDTTQFKATWRFDVTDRPVTFTFRYDIRCAVQLLPDAAYLNWQAIGDGWEKVTDHAEITVRLPGPARRAADQAIPRPATPCTPGNEPLAGKVVRAGPLKLADVKFYGHGPLQGTARRTDTQTIVLDVRDLGAGQFVEADVLFPANAVPFVGPPSGPIVGPEAPKTVANGAEVIAAEARLAAKANAKRRQLDLLNVAWKVGGFALLPLLILMVVWAFARDRVPGVPRLLQDPPETIHPADLALLWSAYRGKFAPKDVYRAQLLSLAQQGVIEVVADGQVSRPKDLQIRWLKPPTDPLDERFTEFLFADAGTGPVRLRDVKARGTRVERLTGWWKYAAKRTKQPVERLKKGQSRRESILAFVAAAAVAGLGWNAFKILHNRTALMLVPAALVGWLAATKIIPPRLPDDLRGRLARWKAFRRFLKQFSSLRDAPALAVIIWENYLVHATALGVAAQVAKQVQALVPQGSLPAPWPGAPRGNTGYFWANSFSTRVPAQAAVSTSASVASSITWSGSWGSGSGSGGGGGFSGGGGGGGGGTGGGAG